MRRLSRRSFLGGAIAGAAALGLQSGRASAATSPSTKSRGPGSLPNPSAPPGTDQLPKITTIVTLMLENHTYDSILGMLHRRGNGFTLDSGGKPTNSNPWPEHSSTPPPFRDARVRAYSMPDPCQQNNHPFNTWNAGHISYAGGKMDGFVKSQSGPVAMGYYDRDRMPFVYSLAEKFPLCDNYFSSVMAQTYPNRRYFMAATSLGVITDTLNLDRPPNGTIFESLDAHGISWKNYYSSDPSALIWLYLADVPGILPNLVKIDQFFDDAAAGTLPAYSMIDPNFNTQSEEDPQDVQFGDQFMAQVVDALMHSPQWPGILLVWTYDEGGGYYDHVPPPAAVKPDDIPPMLTSGDLPGGFDRYGFRLPSGVVSPYARPDYVSKVVHDHTSILKLIETKWNLPALTYRDAAADDLLDSVDLESPPAFLTPPRLAPPPDPDAHDGCLTTGPGTIPPRDAVVKGR